MLSDKRLLMQKIDRLGHDFKQISKPKQKNLSPRTSKNMQVSVLALADQLQKVMRNLDPIQQPDFVFDTSQQSHVGQLMHLALLSQLRRPLADVPRFYGSGIYVLYYTGKYKPYLPISGTEHPIYIGKAEPLNSMAMRPSEQGDKLTSRLYEHRRDIKQAQDDSAKTLFLSDFECRFLVMQSGLEAVAESYLIQFYQPIWNDQIGICYGFGQKDCGYRSLFNQRSPWDTLHPGRDWAYSDAKMQDEMSAAKISCELVRYFQSNPPIKTIDKVFKRFIAEMRQT